MSYSNKTISLLALLLCEKNFTLILENSHLKCSKILFWTIIVSTYTSTSYKIAKEKVLSWTPKGR